jgi:hypothetical protein
MRLRLVRDRVQRVRPHLIDAPARVRIRVKQAEPTMAATIAQLVFAAQQNPENRLAAALTGPR